MICHRFRRHPPATCTAIDLGVAVRCLRSMPLPALKIAAIPC